MLGFGLLGVLGLVVELWVCLVGGLFFGLCLIVASLVVFDCLFCVF